MATLSEAGFSLGADRLGDLQSVAATARDLTYLSQRVLAQQVRAAITRETGIALADVGLDTTLDAINSQARAEWLAEQIRTIEPQSHLTGDRILALAREYRQTQRLQQVAGDEPPREGGGIFGLAERTQWLIVLSFMVCVVGVANAMLMSVTERFTEIATMKCLGAMDRFVMMMFVFEAILQGLIGGLVGLVLGVLLALLRAGAEFGGLLTHATPALVNVGIAMAISLTIGVVLAAAAAVGPSYVAAKLAPMEAMRVE